MSQLWRLSSGEDEVYRWMDYTWLVSGQTPQDAMRKVIVSIKAQNARWAHLGCEPEPIPQVMWAAPFEMPEVTSMARERYEVGEDFENMFDYDHAIEVRL